MAASKNTEGSTIPPADAEPKNAPQKDNKAAAKQILDKFKAKDLKGGAARYLNFSSLPVVNVLAPHSSHVCFPPAAHVHRARVSCAPQIHSLSWMHVSAFSYIYQSSWRTVVIVLRFFCSPK